MESLSVWLKENWYIGVAYLLLHLPIIYIPFFSLLELAFNICIFEVWLICLLLVIATMRYKIEMKFENKLRMYELKSAYPAFIKNLGESINKEE
jgi:hypothetical protein